MNTRMFVALAAAIFVMTNQSPAADKVSTKTEKKSSGAASESPDLSAIRKTEDSFKKAFDAGDAKAVAAHWTADGEYTDEDGNRTLGRDEIEKKYAEFFAAHPGAKIISHIDSLRLLNADTALEDGTAAVVPVPEGASGASRYKIVHVKNGDAWQMASVTDSRFEPPRQSLSLDKLDSIIGTWTAEHRGVELTVTSRWIADKKFVEQKFETRQGGKVTTSGTQIIGYDGALDTLTSWMFTSDGGHAYGIWSPHEGGWAVEAKGMLADGTPTHAVNITKKLDDNAIVWRSLNRSAGDAHLLDTDEVILKRSRVEQKQR